MDPARELAQLGEPGRQLLGHLLDQRDRLRLVAHARLQHAQVERQADQLLLRAVVQVALEPAARGVGRIDDAHA